MLHCISKDAFSRHPYRLNGAVSPSCPYSASALDAFPGFAPPSENLMGGGTLLRCTEKDCLSETMPVSASRRSPLTLFHAWNLLLFTMAGKSKPLKTMAGQRFVTCCKGSENRTENKTNKEVFVFFLRCSLPSTKSEVVQIERKAKQITKFLLFSP